MRQATPLSSAVLLASAPSGEGVAGAPTGRFDDLAARGEKVAPGMHEVVRSEGASGRVVFFHAERSDACLRAAFEAAAPVVAQLVDARGNVLATTDAPATRGVLGERGPVCIRRGDTVSAVVEPAGGEVRWMAWAAGT